jgi:hypothetical protein
LDLEINGGCRDHNNYPRCLGPTSNLYAPSPIFGLMGNGHFIYHEALLVRLVSMAVIVVFGPALCMLLIAGSRLTKHSAQRIGQNMRPRQWHLS